MMGANYTNLFTWLLCSEIQITSEINDTLFHHICIDVHFGYNVQDVLCSLGKECRNLMMYLSVTSFHADWFTRVPTRRPTATTPPSKTTANTSGICTVFHNHKNILSGSGLFIFSGCVFANTNTCTWFSVSAHWCWFSQCNMYQGYLSNNNTQWNWNPKHLKNSKHHKKYSKYYCSADSHQSHDLFIQIVLHSLCFFFLSHVSRGSLTLQW